MTDGLDAVLFDWGDTLVHFPGFTTSPAEHRACVEALYGELAAAGHRDCFARAGVDWPRFLAAYDATSADQHRFSRETHREHRLDDRLARTLAGAGCRCRLDAAELDALVARLAEHLLTRARPVDGVRAVLDAVAGRYRVGVVANYPWPPLVARSLERYGLSPYLEVVVVSGALGWVKPNPRPFQQALAALGVEPARALFVGDDLVNDVRGARAAGLRTAWLAPGRPPGSEPAADHHLERLSDLLAVLGASTGTPERSWP